MPGEGQFDAAFQFENDVPARSGVDLRAWQALDEINKNGTNTPTDASWIEIVNSEFLLAESGHLV